MSTQGTRTFDDIMERIAAWLQPGLRRVFTVDSRERTWARPITSFAELPDAYRPFLDGLTSDQKEPLPYLVLTPTFKGIGRRMEAERLVGLAGEALHVIEQRDGRLISRQYPLHGRCRVERGVLLLHSWITVHGPGAGDQLESVTLRFNSVTDHLMAPFVAELRPQALAAAGQDLEAERERFNYLAQTHYKFYSHGRSSIRPGDRVQQVLLQPQLRSGQMGLFGYRLSRRISPAHLTILTDTELILIRDDESQFWMKGLAHGAIWNYIPRGLIREATLGASEADRLTMSIELPGGQAVQAIFGLSARAELDRLVSALQR
jgi:hypothetical protein